MKTQSEKDSTCCPEFDPVPWDDRIFEWENKKFIIDSVCTLFYMPLNFRKIMKRLDKRIADAGATIQDGLCLSDHTSKWNMNVYIAVNKDIPGTKNTLLSGKFYGKVYEGPFRDTGRWCEDYENIVKSKGLQIKKWFMWYTTCPKCAKKYGKNYVAIISNVE